MLPRTLESWGPGLERFNWRCLPVRWRLAKGSPELKKGHQDRAEELHLDQLPMHFIQMKLQLPRRAANVCS